MGFRLSVKQKGSDKWYGDDHKLYGYAPYEKVKMSFDILIPYMKEQWPDWFYNLDTDKDGYDFMCYVSATDELVLDHLTFSKWVLAYIHDLRENNKSEELILKVGEYLNLLSLSEEDKILEWN